jgi:uncharacterized protein involved in exopolysaccharide biosynthesis
MVNPGAVDETSGLREYGLAIWHQKILVILVIVIVTGGVLGYCAATKPKYTATTQLELEPQISNALIEANDPEILGAAVDVPTQIEVIASKSVRDAVDTKIPHAPHASVSQVGTTDVVNVECTSTNKVLAAQCADTYATTYIKQEQEQVISTFVSAEQILQKRVGTEQVAIASVNNQLKTATGGTLNALDSDLSTLETELTSLQNQLANYDFYASNGTASNIGQVISTANIPTTPSSPKTIEYTVIAFIIGVILALGLALLRNALRGN